MFATIFRRESNRTAVVSNAVATSSHPMGSIMSPEQAASHPGMDSYDIWAATSFDKFLRRGRTVSPKQMAWIASGISRSPLCEAVWAEMCLSKGKLPWQDPVGYDAMSRKYRPFVRPWPKRMGKTNKTYFELLSGLSVRAKTSRYYNPMQHTIDPVGLLMVDQPWLYTRDVWSDPSYSTEIPPANLHGKTIEWDVKGLLKRVEHEMLVMGAAFSLEMQAALDQS